MNKRLLLTLAGLAPIVAFGQTIVNDSWADANRANTGALQADWWSSSSTSGNSVEAYTGQLGLVTGTSGRGIHGTFTPQILGVGDNLTVTYTFTTPVTVGTEKSTGFRVALMDFNNPGLAADLSSSSSSVNPLYVGQPGYMSTFDVNMADDSDNVTIYKHDVTAAGGRFTGTTAEWINMGGSANADYAFAANTTYVGVFSVTRTGADEMTIFSSMSQNSILMDSHTMVDASSIANNFGMLGFWANSNNFGSTTTIGEVEDNGITFSNIMVEYSAVPEPSTYALLLAAFALGFVFFRRRK